MFHLSREVRFAVDLMAGQPRRVAGPNGFAGKPPVTGMGQCYYTVTVTVAGEPDPVGGYLVNIKAIDDAVRDCVIPHVKQTVHAGCQGNARGGGGLVLDSFKSLRDAFSPHDLVSVQLALSPYTRLTVAAPDIEQQMISLTHTFEFAASHRLHNPSMSDEQNRAMFGKCNNVHGHGHNYVVEVTLTGQPDDNGVLLPIERLETIVDDHVIGVMDHKHLNVEVDEFSRDGGLNPSVENIAKVCYDRLAEPVDAAGSTLQAVRVWETPKTWCEYRRD